MSDEIRKLLQARRSGNHNLRPRSGDEVGIELVGPRKEKGPYNAQLLNPATAGQLLPGNQGGNLRTAIKKGSNSMHGKPPPGDRIRIDEDGNAEVYNPLAEWEARDNRT